MPLDQHTHCTGCKKESDVLKRCMKCYSVAYCDKVNILFQLGLFRVFVLIFVEIFPTELPTNALERGAPYHVSPQTGYSRPTVCHQSASIVAHLPETLPVDALLLQVSDQSIYNCVEIGEFLGVIGARGFFHQGNRMPLQKKNGLQIGRRVLMQISIFFVREMDQEVPCSLDGWSRQTRRIRNRLRMHYCDHLLLFFLNHAI